MIVLLELLTVLLEYIDLFVIAILISKNSYHYTNILPIMLALCSMLSDTYYAHNYASIIGGSLTMSLKYKRVLVVHAALAWIQSCKISVIVILNRSGSRTWQGEGHKRASHL